jgi:uncharacterized protein
MRCSPFRGLPRLLRVPALVATWLCAWPAAPVAGDLPSAAATPPRAGAGPVPSVEAPFPDDLRTLDGFAFPVRHSPGLEDRTRVMAGRIASVLERFEPRLGLTPEVTLLVLAEVHWSDHTAFPVYGMPHILGGRTLVVAGEDNALWRSTLPDPDALPLPLAGELRRVYGDGTGGLTAAPFFDLLAIHELGHAYTAQAGVDTQRLWMGEFLPNLLLHTWVEEAAPELLPALTLLPDLGVAAGPGNQPFTTLDELEAHYVRIGQQHPENYAWYQFRWHQGARRIYEAGGGRLLDRLWAALRDTSDRLDDPALLHLLDTRVHRSLGDLVREWDAETMSPPAARVGEAPAASHRPLPILDMHLHAGPAHAQGPPPVAICRHWYNRPGWDPGLGSLGDEFMGLLTDPPCDDPLWSPETDEALMRETLEVLDRRNVYGVLSGPATFVRRWREAAPDRIIPGLTFDLGTGQPSTDTLRAMHARGDLAVFGEIITQYRGILPTDDALVPYWALAEELDIPVGIHVGTGPPGAPYLGFGDYRARLHSALTMEEVLVRHPRLRVYLMHAGYPFLDDLLALMYVHPQVHVDVGAIVFALHRPAFHRYLQALVEAGYGKRILFGTDQMVWPGLVEWSIQVIEEAPFLSEEEKRDILYNNAARFLRLSPEEIAGHHGEGSPTGTEGPTPPVRGGATPGRPEPPPRGP